MRAYTAHHLNRYAAWCDDQPARAASIAARLTFRATAPLGLPTAALLAMQAAGLAAVVVSADLAPKRAAAAWLARRLG